MDIGVNDGEMISASNMPYGEWVRHADCRVGMRELADKSVSLVLTDPPYFLDGMDDGWDDARLRARTKPGVVGGLPGGMRFDPAQARALYDFLLPVAREWARVIKPGGFALCFSQPRLAHRATLAIEDAGFEIRDMLAWMRNGQAKAFSLDHFVRRRNDLPEDEKARMIAALDGKKTPQLRPRFESVILAQASREGTFAENWLRYGTGLMDTREPLLGQGETPSTMIAAAKPRRRGRHMTEKPVDLLRHLIRLFCPEGSDAIVLDSFAGSGSSGVAAIMEGRAFVGFERNEEWVRKANKRIEEIIFDDFNNCVKFC